MMTNSALLVGGAAHHLVAQTNGALNDVVTALQPRGPAKLLLKWFGKVDAATGASIAKSDVNTNLVWKPLSEGAEIIGQAMVNPLVSVYAKRAGFPDPTDQNELSRITHEKGWSTPPPPAPPAGGAPDPNAPPAGGEPTPAPPAAGTPAQPAPAAGGEPSQPTAPGEEPGKPATTTPGQPAPEDPAQPAPAAGQGQPPAEEPGQPQAPAGGGGGGGAPATASGGDDAPATAPATPPADAEPTAPPVEGESAQPAPSGQ
jgi:hypothetical protein